MIAQPRCAKFSTESRVNSTISALRLLALGRWFRFCSHPQRRQSRGYGLHRRLSVCFSFARDDISKTDAARITKLDTEMFHRESWKSIYFGVKRSKVKVTRHKKNSAGVGFGTLVSAGFFSLNLCTGSPFCTSPAPEPHTWVYLRLTRVCFPHTYSLLQPRGTHYEHAL